ncbi:MAG: GAF domain-containing protein [Chloroflexi bacterium]|nr:GAF domain-containing protein [Chloroflexota bacterium]
MASQSLPATHDVPREPAPASTAPGQADSPRPELYAAQLEQSRQQAEDQLLALRTLQQIAQSLTSELNLDKLLRKVLRSALDVMEADAGSLLLHDPATDQLVFEVIEGGASEALKGRRMSSADGIAGWVFTHGESLIVDDTSKDNRFYADIDKSFGHKTWSLICVPLIITGKKIGVLEVLNKISGARFTSADRDILSALAAQSAIAIENARLYQDLWEERNRILAVEEEVRKELARATCTTARRNSCRRW